MERWQDNEGSTRWTWPRIVVVGMRGVVLAFAFAGSAVAGEPVVAKQVPIKELHERTSSLVGRDLVVAGVAEAVEPITTENFDDWRLGSPCVGSYFVTVKDETGLMDVLMRGNCISKLQAIHGPRIEKGQKIWAKIRIFVPDLNIYALHPTVRAVAQDFGHMTSE